ncbi:MAG: hypothetical protein E6767_08395 [Dysgonomonas sp.]|nr:hypothetical protein [Dysgonomonas sp.]
MEAQVKKLQHKLILLFWINIAVSILALLIILYMKGPGFGENLMQNVSFEQYAIILSLAGIPIALKLFQSKYQKIKNLECLLFLKKYFEIYLIRLGILDIIILINLSGLYLFESQNAVYMTIITIFALFFCYPNKKNILNENK